MAILTISAVFLPSHRFVSSYPLHLISFMSVSESISLSESDKSGLSATDLRLEVLLVSLGAVLQGCVYPSSDSGPPVSYHAL